MGNADWSLDLLERDLAAGFALLGQAERAGGMAPGESQALADGVLRCMNGALMKVSESLEAQARLRRELAQARAEMLQVQTVQTSQAVRIQDLEAEVASLRESLKLERARGAFSARNDGDASLAAGLAPSSAYLERPLVLRSPQGEFLGVTDSQGQALTLCGLLRLVEGGAQGAHAGRVVATCWERLPGAGWCLALTIMGRRTCAYALETRSLLTPSGNLVIQLLEMRVDGQPVPQEFVTRMFRQLREAFQES